MIGPLLGTALAIAATLTLTGIVLLRLSAQRERIRARLIAIVPDAAPRAIEPWRARLETLAGLPKALGAFLLRSGLVSRPSVAGTEQTLRAMGFRGDDALPVFVGAKLLSLLALPTLAWLALDWLPAGLRQAPALPLAAAAIGGLLLPDLVVSRMRAAYLRRLERGLPDALDMMIICVDAGLGLDAAIERVGEEIAIAHPDVAREFALTAREMKMLTDREAALLNMGARTGLEQLRRMGATWVQTLRYGTPLAQALRVLANEMRQEQLTRFEARAARLPVTLTIPLILFILPTLFLIIAGPAALRVFRL